MDHAPIMGAFLCVLILVGCTDSQPIQPVSTDYDSDRGRVLIGDVGCGACHRIPGVPGARGRVGPSLRGFGERNFIAGTVPNRFDLLASWVRDAPALRPDTAMPSMPLNDGEAGDVAAYLYTLGE